MWALEHLQVLLFATLSLEQWFSKYRPQEPVRRASSLLSRHADSEILVGGTAICFNKFSTLFYCTLYFENHLEISLSFSQKLLLSRKTTYWWTSLTASWPTKAPYHTVFSHDCVSSDWGEGMLSQLYSEMHSTVACSKGYLPVHGISNPGPFFLHTSLLNDRLFCILVNKYKQVLSVCLVRLKKKL